MVEGYLMNHRRLEGSETVARIIDWTRGQTPAERLAAHLLRAEGFDAIDPSHPLGGPDGLKDVVCIKNNVKWLGAAYFPRGQQSFRVIKKKFIGDLDGTKANQVDGFIFITNQELKLNEREQLKTLKNGDNIEIYHLERIGSILDSPQCYGVRLEYLDIEMTREEQLAFIEARDSRIQELQEILKTIVTRLQDSDLLKSLSPDQLRTSIPLSEIKEFKAVLDSIIGLGPYITSSYSLASASRISSLQVPLSELREYANILERISGYGNMLGIFAHVNKLQVPLADLKEYANVLDQISGYANMSGIFAHVNKLQVPIADLKEYANILDRISGYASMSGYFGHVNKLQVPLADLKEYEATLDRINGKLQEKRRLESK
jgi:hypothetical protein